MIALRIAVAALMVSAAPIRTGAQESLPDVGATPSDWSGYARALAASNRPREAIAAYERAIQVQSSRADECAWAIARLYAQLENRKQAMRWVERALDLGFSDRGAIRTAPEFLAYREDARLNQLLRPFAVSRVRVAVLPLYHPHNP